MKQHLQILIDFLTQNDFKSAQQHYVDSSESENVVQLAFIFQQGNNKLSNFETYQQIATKFIKNKAFPEALIAQIKTTDTLSFFTPALQLDNNFSKIDHQQRNVLHYLLAGNTTGTDKVHPPFNYLRSMMLFERNEVLCAALCQRDYQNLTPVETYLLAHSNLTDLPGHELSALFALIEIESKQQAVMAVNYKQIIEAVVKHCHHQKWLINSDLERLILIASYYNQGIENVVNDIT
ncbi:MAG: hypothetical protein ACI9LM_002952 [Alteromonadaceae bacterium]|jgi:hypothetical protein